MVLENGNNLENENQKKEALNLLSTDLVDALKNMESLETIKDELNINNRRLTAEYNAGKLGEERTISFLKGLEYFKNQGGEIVFTGGFDMDLMDIVSGDITELKIEDGKVKVLFTLDDGTPRTDEVDLKDAFCTDFSFHCK